jgi:hypothetical protein
MQFFDSRTKVERDQAEIRKLSELKAQLALLVAQTDSGVEQLQKDFEMMLAYMSPELGGSPVNLVLTFLNSVRAGKYSAAALEVFVTFATTSITPIGENELVYLFGPEDQQLNRASVISQPEETIMLVSDKTKPVTN